MTNSSHIYDIEQDRIDEQASDWIVRLDERELTPAEQGEFHLWLAADARHRHAWRDLSSAWETIPVLNNIGHLVVPEPIATESRWSRMRLPKLALGAFGAIAATLLLLFVAPSLLSGSEIYQTGVAQTRLLTLDDGSQVTLGPQSKLTVKFDDDERRVVLTGGEAFFEVTHNRERPFLVEAGRSMTRVVGTRFDVNFATTSVRIAVLEGLVQVSKPDLAKRLSVIMLQAGQRAEINLASGAEAEPTIARLSASPPGAWREGRLVYENSRLADLISDVNRYYAPGVTVGDKAILDLRVTASFKTTEIPAFLGSVGSVLPVKATETSDGSYRLEAAGK